MPPVRARGPESRNQQPRSAWNNTFHKKSWPSTVCGKLGRLRSFCRVKLRLDRVMLIAARERTRDNALRLPALFLNGASLRKLTGGTTDQELVIPTFVLEKVLHKSKES